MFFAIDLTLILSPVSKRIMLSIKNAFANDLIHEHKTSRRFSDKLNKCVIYTRGRKGKKILYI